jgi:hypothetical protein
VVTTPPPPSFFFFLTAPVFSSSHCYSSNPWYASSGEAPALINHHITGLRHLQRYSSSACYLCFLGENVSRFRTQPSFSEGLKLPLSFSSFSLFQFLSVRVFILFIVFLFFNLIFPSCVRIWGSHWKGFWIWITLIERVVLNFSSLILCSLQSSIYDCLAFYNSSRWWWWLWF